MGPPRAAPFVIVKFKTYELADIKNGGFELSKKVEARVLEIVGSKLNKDTRVDLTEGKNTANDGWIGEDRAEIKISAKTYSGPLKYSNFFETHYKSGKPSALLLTKSKLYVTLSPGWNSTYQQVTGKIRMWNVSDLLSVMGRVYPIVTYDYGEFGFYIPNKSDQIKHTWIGDVKFDFELKQYDLGAML